MFRLLLFLLSAYPCLLFSQDIPQLLREAQVQESQFHEPEAFALYAEILKKDSRNLTALCKCSELCSRIGARQGDKEKMTPYFIAGKNYAAAALKADPNSSEANFVMSLALGRTSLISGTKEKVMLARDVKAYAETAIRLNPDNFRAWHILGKWNYEISNLNFAERSFARLFYGKLPTGSLDDAIRDFDKSRSLFPGLLLNYLELAKSYHRKDQERKAIAYLHVLSGLPNLMYDDAHVKQLARQLLIDWQ